MTRARVILNPASGRERGRQHIETLSVRLREAYDEIEMTVRVSRTAMEPETRSIPA